DYHCQVYDSSDVLF
nr:immunoglobulin light chain junction region [Macaca mulatta]MOV67805.1 immunoglobulin light chain junction region [Macaca mulatta]